MNEEELQYTLKSAKHYQQQVIDAMKGAKTRVEHIDKDYTYVKTEIALSVAQFALDLVTDLIEVIEHLLKERDKK